MEDNHITESPESRGQVGIFWIIDGDIASYGLDSCAGENYGDFKIYPGDHYGTWNDICREFQEFLLYAYDYFPRGRIAYNVVKDLYLLYIDNSLVWNNKFILNLIRILNIKNSEVWIFIICVRSINLKFCYLSPLLFIKNCWCFTAHFDYDLSTLSFNEIIYFGSDFYEKH